MVYIFETQLSIKKSLKYSLAKIYGISIFCSSRVCKQLGFSNNLNVSDLSDDQLKSLIKVIENSNVLYNSDLRNFNREVKNNLIQIKSYRGLRSVMRLPVRGQRTHTNARTCKNK